MTEPALPTIPHPLLRDPLLIGLCGRAGSGKDTAANHLCHHYGFVRGGFADALKDMAAQMLTDAGLDYAALHEPALKEQPLPGLHGTTARQIMQTLGDWGRGLHPDWWVQLLAGRLGLGEHGTPVHDRIVISDVRYPNEAAWVLAQGGVMLRLRREQAAPTRPHGSEAHIDGLPAHFELANHGLTTLGLQGELAHLMATLGVPAGDNPNWGAAAWR